MSVVCLNESSVSVSALLAQIAEYPGVDGLVAVIRVEGCWRTVWTSGVNLGALSMAALKLSLDVTHEMHRGGDEPRVGFTDPENAA